jgi:cell division septum initiation protein DivIVA
MKNCDCPFCEESKVSAILDSAETALGKMHEEIKALKAENARLMAELEELKEPELFTSASLQFRVNERRFEAAKSAMMGFVSNHEFTKEVKAEEVIPLAVEFADALLKALEETK